MTTDVHQSETSNPYRRLPQDLPPGMSPAGDRSGHATMADEAADGDSAEASDYISSEEQLIETAKTIYRASTDYIDSNITTQWETNLAHFNGEHGPATKFRQKNYKRSRVFRPKTRSMTKASEAALTTAMFSTLDVLDMQPEDPTNPIQVASAAINKEMLQYRLDRKVKWYQTVVGAFQSTQVYGLCISMQRWDYHVDTDVVPATNEDGSYIVDDDGSLMGYETEKVRKDDLCIDLIAPENFRFDPMCDWRDPCGTSPYLIYMMPIYAIDALEKMEQRDGKTGQPAWKKYALGDLLATRRKWYDRTRQAREGRERIDPADDQASSAYSTLWAHMNIVNVNGDDMMFWTMGTELLLTDPVPLTEAFPHLREGERPFTVGFSTIEAFRNYPAGDVEQASGLQTEINLVANQRLDNVKLVLNKRYYVKRGAQVDLDALIRNVPGGGVMMNNPQEDVNTVDTRDVTGSSYQEQDRLSVELDELVGAFSQTSVQSNKNLNETVGGMEAMQSGAGAVRDYGLRIFFETWVEPTLRQMVRCEQYYETDATIIALASKKAGLYQKFGIDKITDDLLINELTVRVNVGMGNTDPQRRVEKLMYATKNAAQLPGMAMRMKSDEVADEIYGTLGYKDASRFFRNEDEQKQFIEENPPKEDPEIALKKAELEKSKADDKMRHQREVMRLELDAELGFAKLALEKGLKLSQMYQQLGLDRMKDRTARQSKALDNVVALKEHNLRRETGAGV
jgi:hypothetical protein